MISVAAQSRYAQAYIYTAAKLHECGILPDGIEIKPEIVAQLDQIQPPITRVESDMILVGMVSEGVRFTGTEDARERFAAHPQFSGLDLGVIK